MKFIYIVIPIAIKPEPGSRLKTMSLRPLYLILFILFAQMNVQCAIRVPDDYPSLQEAVEHSAAVDEIIITTASVKLLKEYESPSLDQITGIQIVDKTLVIRGEVVEQVSFPSKSANHYEFFSNLPSFPFLYTKKRAAFYIQNSSVQFENLSLDFSRGNHFIASISLVAPSPIIIDSSDVYFMNCTINSFIKTNSSLQIIDSVLQNSAKLEGYKALASLDYPVLYLDSCSGETIEVVRSSIQSVLFGENTIRLNDCADTDLILNQSRITSQSGSGASLSAFNSNGIHIDLKQSVIKAKYEFPSEGPHYVNPLVFPYGDETWPGAHGGSGISLMNSSLTISGGEIIGGEGSPGSQFYSGGTVTQLCGDGGDAVQLTDSHLQLYKTELFPGLGGVGFAGSVDRVEYPAGTDGVAIQMDENSSVLTSSSSRYWHLFD